MAVESWRLLGSEAAQPQCRRVVPCCDAYNTTPKPLHAYTLFIDGGLVMKGLRVVSTNPVLRSGVPLDLLTCSFRS